VRLWFSIYCAATKNVIHILICSAEFFCILVSSYLAPC